MYAHGWFKIGFSAEFTDSLTPVNVGDLRLMVVRRGDDLSVYNANCPHRGAHLAFGGRVDGCDVVCPFHGYKIALGDKGRTLFSVREYASLAVGGLLFVQLSEQYDNGFADHIRALHESHRIVPGFHMPVNAPAAFVIENGFDNRHFPAVHGILNDPHFTVQTRANGAVTVESEFVTMPGAPSVPYLAHTFSPGLIVVNLSGRPPYSVITGAMPLPDGTTIIHLSLALPRDYFDRMPDVAVEAFSAEMLKYSWRGLEEDKVMWENLVPVDPPQLTVQDDAVLAFQSFCQQFEVTA